MSNFIGLRQVGWGVKDPVALAAFYRDVMGMKVVAQSPANTPMGVTVFLSHHPGGEEHHDLGFFSNPMFAYTGFRAEFLGDLLKFYREVKERGIAIKMTFNHGAALSFYIDDPEGHMIEIYWLTNVRTLRISPASHSTSTTQRRRCNARSSAWQSSSGEDSQRRRTERAQSLAGEKRSDAVEEYRKFKTRKENCNVQEHTGSSRWLSPC